MPPRSKPAKKAARKTARPARAKAARKPKTSARRKASPRPAPRKSARKGARRALEFRAAPARHACSALDPFGDPCQNLPRPGTSRCTIHTPNPAS